MIAILDYGVGNLFSLRSSLQQLGLQATPLPSAPPTGLSCRGWAHSGMPWQSLPPPALCQC
jgi:hypothetical protein